MKHKDNLYFEIFLSSQMDLSYLKIDLKNPDITLQEIKKLKWDSKFIDVGANIGFYSLMASKIIGEPGRVFSFEPSYREYSRLLKNIELNHCNNIIPFNFALTNEIREVLLSTSKSHTGLNTLNSVTEFEISGYQLVQAVTLDYIFSASDVEFDLIKIDVEGAEYLVLQGMQKILAERRIKKIVIEITPKFFNSFGYDKHTLYSFIESFGFKATIRSEDWQYDEIFSLEY